MKNLVDYNSFAVNGIKLAIEPINLFLPEGGGAAVVVGGGGGAAVVVGGGGAAVVAGGDTVEPRSQ